jgi:hypothetical protein
VIEQNTPEWYAARAGKITMSRAPDVLAFDEGGGVWKSGPRKGQTKPAKSLKARLDYVDNIVAEIVTGVPKESVRARPLDWGHDVEGAARAAYEAETGYVVEPGGFVIHRDIPYVGCSPDGLIGTDGQTQLKCPFTSEVHLRTLRDGMSAEHIPQVQGELFVTGRKWSDFVSFDPRMPEHLRLYRFRVERDEIFIRKLRDACISMWIEVQEFLEALNQRAA